MTRDERNELARRIAFAPCVMLAQDSGKLGAVLDSYTERPAGIEYRRTVIDDVTGESTNYPVELLTPSAAAEAQAARIAAGFRRVERRT